MGENGFRYGRVTTVMASKIFESYHIKPNFSTSMGFRVMRMGGNGTEMVMLDPLSAP